ncbi:hypothetical protein GCM10022215_36960 [Nocardioides fonticola]|uniref:Uncharacterized protein n=1 Tax=Nocardioides fonticola TaxID=450363 RepID=A0ABP7XWH9_9ACTN
MKTHHGWTYTPVDANDTSGPPGTGGASYLWTSPHGQHYLRTTTGTTRLTTTA